MSFALPNEQLEHVGHNDPFDHMLLAQAMSEPMRLITGDSVLTQYTPLVLQI